MRVTVGEVDAVVAVDVVACDLAVAVGHAVDQGGVIDAVDRHEYRPAVPAPGAAVDPTQLGGIRRGQGLHISVIGAAVPLLPTGQAGLDVSDRDRRAAGGEQALNALVHQSAALVLSQAGVTADAIVCAAFGLFEALSPNSSSSVWVSHAPVTVSFACV